MRGGHAAARPPGPRHPDGTAPVVLVNGFTLDKTYERPFLRAWHDDALFMPPQPGFILAPVKYSAGPVAAGRGPATDTVGDAGGLSAAGATAVHATNNDDAGSVARLMRLSLRQPLDSPLRISRSPVLPW